MNIKSIAKNAKKDLIFLKKDYTIIKNIDYRKNELKNKVIKISKSFGKILPQNSKGNKILEIKPKKKIKVFTKKLKKEKLRYHETNLGGSIHSDGPQLNNPPNFVFMACINQAKTGGHSTLVSTKKIYNFLHKNKKSLLKTLTRKFYFEKRGFSKEKTKSVLAKPIFKKNKNKITFRYLREYIEAGYKIKKKKLSKNQVKSLNYLDNLLSSKKFSVNFKLGKGDLLILNNNHVAHGRTKFALEKNNRRRLIRVWVR